MSDQPQTDNNHITAEDLYNLGLIGDPQLSPDGRHVIYVLQRVDRQSEKKYSNLWLVPAGGGSPPRQFTYGDHTDRQPRWSPDGNQIAFLSNRKDEKQPQLHLIPFHGGEARPLTELKGTIAAYEWSPDGSRFVCQFRKKDAEAIAREEDEAKKKLGVVERHVTRALFRVDGSGYLPQERWHIWLVDASSGEATQLTEGDALDETSPRWSPDGEQILFASNRSDDPDFQPERVGLYIIPAAGGEMRRLDAPDGGKFGLAFSPDGQYVSYVGSEGRGNWWQNNQLWIVPADGSAPARSLTAGYDVHVSNSTISDVGDRPFTTPVWSAAADRIYCQISRHGSTSLQAVTLEGALEPVLDPPGVISDFSFDADRRKLAYIYATFEDPGQIWVRDLDQDSGTKLTDVNDDWLAEKARGEVEEVWYTGPDGNDLQGWILKPPGFDPQQKYPSILEIHGGPWLQYGHLFMHEFYYLAAAGYVVYFTNPRGGHGYGEDHGRAIQHNWGGPDFADVMAWVDYMRQQPYIDSERMGITGGSYGGYLTLWTIGQTDRFRAAVAQRVVSNAISFWGSSDVGYFFEDPWANNQAPWENLDAYWDQSPMKYVGNVTTPTLFIHSEGDMRTHMEQGVQAFTALKRQGVDTELVLFPEESHGLSRGGRTDRRIARLKHIRRWFDAYLKDASSDESS